MSATLWGLYAGYLVWLAAGCLDFLCHRRTDLPQTSGLPESLLHLLQTGLMGAMVTVWMLGAPSLMLSAGMAVLVLMHAMAGYADTRVAWKVRPITPLEQHLHSVLDAAPWVMLLVVLYQDSAAAVGQGWRWAWRSPALPLSVWAAVMMPAGMLCLLPLARELSLAWRATNKPRAGP